MEYNLYYNTKNILKSLVEKGNKKFIIYPFGKMGEMVKDLLNKTYRIEEICIIDNINSNNINNIYLPKDIANLADDDYLILFASVRIDIREELLNAILKYVNKEKIIDLFSETAVKAADEENRCKYLNDKFSEIGIQKLIGNELCYFGFKNIKSKFFLPYHEFDFIQKQILLKQNYFSYKDLNYLFKVYKNGFLSEHIKDGAVLDIGSNIGNHVLYYANECDCKKIYAFEPIKNTFEMLQENIKINGLDNIVKSYNVGLSDCESSGKICVRDFKNIGATKVNKDIPGDVVLKTLDSYKIDDYIKFIKIDVEDMEIDVLNGAAETIKKYLPIIYVETFKNLEEIKEKLFPLGYKLIWESEEYDYLFSCCPIK